MASYQDQNKDKLFIIDNPRKNLYLDKLFCWVEQGNIEQLDRFLKNFPNISQKIMSQNQWSLTMYACRYGSVEILRLLQQHRFSLQTCLQKKNYSLIHSACFGHSIEVLRYLVEEQGLEVNPQISLASEQTPLRYALKQGSMRVIEYLIQKGAYYVEINLQENKIIYENNLKAVLQKQELKYYTIGSSKEGQQEIQSNLVLKLDTNSNDTNGIKNIFRWIRYKNILVFHYIINVIIDYERQKREKLREKDFGELGEVQKNMKEMQGILDNQKMLKSILKYL